MRSCAQLRFLSKNRFVPSGSASGQAGCRTGRDVVSACVRGRCRTHGYLLRSDYELGNCSGDITPSVDSYACEGDVAARLIRPGLRV